MCKAHCGYPEQSRDLSEAVRSWMGRIGIDVEYKSLRSNVHILEYFIVGLAVCGYCRSRGWKNWVRMIAGSGIGVVDECMKTLLPGREFSTGDMVRDWVGVAVAGLIMLLIRKRTEDRKVEQQLVQGRNEGHKS